MFVTSVKWRSGWIRRWVAEVGRETGGKEDEDEGVTVGRMV